MTAFNLGKNNSLGNSSGTLIMMKPFVVMLIGFVFTIVGINNAIDDRAFEQHGKEAVIQPLEKYTQVTEKQGVSTRSVKYEGDLTFLTEDGQTITVHKHIPEPLLQDLISGKKVTISYLSDKPEKNRFGTEQGIIGAGEIWFFGLVFIIGLIWFRKKSKAAS